MDGRENKRNSKRKQDLVPNNKEEKSQEKKKEIKVVCGLDLSTTHVGYCVLDVETNEILTIHSVNFKTKDSFWKRLEVGTDIITDIHKKYNVDKFYVEKSLEAFSGGMSTAKTIITLSNFNILFRYKLSLNLGLSVEDLILVGASTARKHVGVKIDKTLTATTKEQVLEQIIGQGVDSTLFPKRVPTRGKMKGKEVYGTYCFDMGDAYVIAKYGVLTENKT